MTSRAPRLSGRELVAALEGQRFRVARLRGSHHLLRHADGRTKVVPVHGNETLGPGLLGKILRDTRLEGADLER